MLKKLSLLSFAGLLMACSSGPKPYGAASNNAGIGFENRKIEQDRFRISYTSPHEAEARDFALLRAAEVTLREGYTHFKIIDGGLSSNGPSPVAIGAGIGTGRGRYGRTNSDIAVAVADVARVIEGSKFEETLEIRLLPTAGSKSDPSIYDATQVTQNIKPKYYP